MKTAAGCIALLIAAILLIGSAVDYKADIDNAPSRTSRAFSNLASGNDAANDRAYAEHDSEQTSQAVRAVAGAAFLIAGLFIFGTRKKKAPQSS